MALCIHYFLPRGYASSFEWIGDHEDKTDWDEWKRRRTTVIAMDALIFKSKSSQFKAGTINTYAMIQIYIGSICYRNVKKRAEQSLLWI